MAFHTPIAHGLTAFALALLIVPASSQAAVDAHVTPPPGLPSTWSSGRFIYETNGSPIADVLNIFASGQQRSVRIGPGVGGVVRGRYAMAPEQFLDTLCASFGLVWYFDGAVLQVTRADMQRRMAIQPNYMSVDALSKALSSIGVIDVHFPLLVNREEGTVTLTGPPDYLARVRHAAQGFEQQARAATRTAARAIRLDNATAADRTTAINGRTLVLPGAATLLKQRFAMANVKHQESNLLEDTASLPSTAMMSSGNVLPPTEHIEFDPPLPIIEADARTNSILIRDRPERIDGDAMLVSDIDVQPQLVSIQAWVVDIDQTKLATLPGLPGKVLASLTMPLLAEAPAATATPASTSVAELALPSAASNLATDAPSNGSASATLQPVFGVVDAEGTGLLAGLAVLEKAQQASVAVSRTAMTMDQTPTVIDRHEAQMAQRIADGEDDGQTDISNGDGGLWLSIVPTIGRADAASSISLAVDLGSTQGKASNVRAASPISVNLHAGEALVIAAPSPVWVDGRAGRRLILLIPRVAA